MAYIELCCVTENNEKMDYGWSVRKRCIYLTVVKHLKSVYNSKHLIFWRKSSMFSYEEILKYNETDIRI